MPSVILSVNQIPKAKYVDSEWVTLSGSGLISPFINYKTNGKVGQLDVVYKLPTGDTEYALTLFPTDTEPVNTNLLALPAGSMLKMRAYCTSLGAATINVLY